MQRLCFTLLWIVTLAFAVSPAASDVVVNGDFSAGIAGWFADGDVAVGGPADSALLGEGSPFPGPPPGLLEQTFTPITDPVSLSFEFSFEVVVDGTAGAFFDDLFQVELFATGMPELFTDAFGFASDTILAVDRFGVFENQGSIGAGAVLDSLFTLDLTGLGLGAGDELTLRYFMFGDEDGFTSVGSVDDVALTGVPTPPDETDSEAPIPEPSTLLLLGSGLAGLAAWRRRKAG